jgi:hypothetical protein
MTFADLKMRAAQLYSLAIPAALGAAVGLALIGCHKTGAPAAQSGSSRGLRVEAYDAPIPKAPLNGKLETMTPRAGAVAASSLTPQAPAPAPASSEPAAVPPQAAAEPLRVTLLRAARYSVQADQAGGAQPAPLYSPAPTKPVDADAADAEPGFRITLPVCRRAAGMNDPLADTTECREILRAARDQARLCAKAFENGDDKVVMSAACRQAARLR